ncbi:MAG: glycosyltransferase [Rhodococcus sp. (in: high G+C Gram-positive bacteria)]|nr:glycosyltransferase [Rhodococcus sp. (in: high G+C Gram-positive bacteria)]
MSESIAVVIVTHNGERYLPEQVRSILTQSLAPQLIVLVDDQSHDSSVSTVTRLVAGSGIELRVVKASPARGISLFTRIAANFERGLREVTQCRFVAFSDQDDVWEPHRLAHQSERLVTTGAAITVGDGMLIDEQGQLLASTLREHFPVLDDWSSSDSLARFRSVAKSPMATGATMMIDRALVTPALPIPAGWLHDRWLSLVAASRDTLDVDEEMVVRYRISEGQTVGVKSTVDKSPAARILGSLCEPFATVRKMHDLTHRLRQLATDENIRRQLTLARMVRLYLR